MSSEKAIRTWMVEHHKTLALAESCTGGRIAVEITTSPGASSYFLGSIVAYSNLLKENLLGVSPKTLKEKGAVSSEAVQEMLQGLFRVTRADFGIAVSGIAGPDGGSVQRPVGTVWYALGARDKTAHEGTLHLTGTREEIILQTTHTLLDLLRQSLY